MGDKIERLSDKVQLTRYFVPTYPNPRWKPGGDLMVDAHWVETDDINSLPPEERAAIQRATQGVTPARRTPETAEDARIDAIAAEQAASDRRQRALVRRLGFPDRPYQAPGTPITTPGLQAPRGAPSYEEVQTKVRKKQEAAAAERAARVSIQPAPVGPKAYAETANEIMPDGLPRVTETTVANPGWEYEDARGVKKRGVVEKTVDRGGTDVTYFMRSEDGDLDLLRGELLKKANTIGELVRVPRSRDPRATEIESPRPSMQSNLEKLRGKVSGKEMEPVVSPDPGNQAVYPDRPELQEAFDRLNLGDRDLDELNEMLNDPLGVSELEAVNNEIALLEGDEEEREAEEARRLNAKENASPVPGTPRKQFFSDLPDDEVWAGQAKNVSYEEAEDKFNTGQWTADQWEAYQHLWATGAPRYSSVAQPVTPYEDLDPVVKRYVDLVKPPSAVERLQEKTSEKKGGTVTLFGVGGGKFNVVQGTGRGGSRVKVIAYGVTREEAERVAKESGYRVQGRFL